MNNFESFPTLLFSSKNDICIVILPTMKTTFCLILGEWLIIFAYFIDRQAEETRHRRHWEKEQDFQHDLETVGCTMAMVETSLSKGENAYFSQYTVNI